MKFRHAAKKVKLEFLKQRDHNSVEEWAGKNKIDFSDHSLADVWDLLMNEVPLGMSNLADQAAEELEARISKMSKRSYEV